ncbi:MAG: hypothetical protein ACYDAE_24770 [Steroidobacteraceae bacterium]
MQQVLGWGFDQWAIAAARLGRPREVSFDEAYRLKRRWEQLHTSAPGDVPLIGMRAPRDDAFAAELLAQGQAMLERQAQQQPKRKRA